jgi:organic hydroperoxide reductase OsmC/OhrA
MAHGPEPFGSRSSGYPLMMTPEPHRFSVQCHWSGSTGHGYGSYDRTHSASAGSACAQLRLSAAEAFRGDPDQLNPEQLVVLAAASCQLLSFLAVASRARIDVLSYEDDAEGVMPENDLPMRLTHILLRPTIRVAEGTDVKRIAHLVQVAHRECFIANSVTTEIEVDPTIVIT